MTVAKIKGVASISKATVDHWIPIEAVLLYEEVPRSEVPSGVIPDPPAYSACIARLAKSSHKNAAAAGVRVALKRKCRANDQSLKVLALNSLINWEWTIGQAAAWGVKVTSAEIAQHLQATKKGFFRTDAEYQKYLKWTRQTQADMEFRARVGALESRLGEKLAATEKRLPKGLAGQKRETALEKLTSGLPRTSELVAITSCSPGYITSDCKEYKGPVAPGTPN